MLSESTIRKISEIFVGDFGSLYSYKKGYELVDFFNEHFGFEDKYGQGFPSRWAYVAEKIKQLMVFSQLDEFFSLIFSKQFVMKDCQIGEVEALELIQEILSELGKQLKSDGYMLARIEEEYRLLETAQDLIFIKSGGYANVFERKNSKRVLKKLKDEWIVDKGIRSRFKREYQITKSLEGIGGIIRLFDYFEDEVSYEMEKAYITLFDHVTKNHPTDNEKQELIVALLTIMSQVHEKGIVHRDLSPTNIFMIKGQLKVADFGLGKNFNEVHSYQTLHTNGVGQYQYTAPEQLFSLKLGDFRSDVFSLGRIINFVLTGNPINEHHYLMPVAMKATNKEPEDRYANMEGLLRDVTKVLKVVEKRNLKEEAKEKIQNGILDIEVEQFIFSLTGEELCTEVIFESSFIPMLIDFMKFGDGHAFHVINNVFQYYQDVCQTFESNDPIASLATCVLEDTFPFTVKEKSAIILHQIAYDVNRFGSQRTIDRLIRQGIDPLLEDILSR